MHHKILLILSIFFSGLSQAQTTNISWNDLTDVNFKETFVEQYGDYFLTPDFGDNVKALEGQTIEIKGYVLDLIGDGKVFLLSKLPMASCFFCGMAGPETIIELQFNEDQQLKTDQVISVQGSLKLNKEDVNHCNYILTNTKIVK
jgi:hypothetical protein